MLYTTLNGRLAKRKKESKNMATGKFVAYYRVSTEQQGKSGLGLDAQRNAVRGYLNGGEWELIAEFEEQESGKNNNRPELAAALKRCRLTGATLVVAKLDRLSRSAAFLVNLMESKVKFVCVDNPNANELTIHILAAVAQQERKAISERTRAALQAAKKRGVVLGNPNLDAVRPTDTSAANAKRVALAKEWGAEIAEAITDIRASGASTLSGIAAALNERGITTRRGGKWSAVQVDRVLNPKAA
jgi:DNA invertase Pin-like site-specific DNA recombinase